MSFDTHADRNQRRYPYTGNILINNYIMVKGIDISMGGVYVYTGRSFERGRIVDVTIPDYRFTVKARIQHNQPGVGMGLKFMAMGEELKRRLRLLLDTLEVGEASVSAKSKPEILLIDDNDNIRRINKSKLHMEGFHVTEAADGLAGIKALQERIPDVIVSNVFLEGMEGLKVLAMIKSDPEWAKIPVIMLSSSSSSDIIDRVMEAGADEFLVKGTTTPAKLAEHVKAIHQKHSA